MACAKPNSQAALLSRLYQNKQKQLMDASKHGDTLLYRVLEAEAQAIDDALQTLSRR